jgi:hypothetical protein
MYSFFFTVPLPSRGKGIHVWTDREGFTKYVVEMSSGAIMYRHIESKFYDYFLAIHKLIGVDADTRSVVIA